MATFRTRRVPSGGETIYYEVATPEGGEDAPVVVLTHGAGANHVMWFRQVVALAERYRVVTWDSRGCGNSTSGQGQLRADDASADLEAILDDAAIDGPVHLVGQSLGGWYVVEFALDHPDRVRSLVLVDTAGSALTPELDAHWKEMTKHGIPPAPDEVPMGTHPGMAPGCEPATAFLYHQIHSLHDGDMSRALDILLDKRHAHEEITALGVPILVAVGEHDHAFPPAMLRKNAELVGAEFVQFDGAGHSPYFEQPEKFNAVVLEFLDRVH